MRGLTGYATITGPNGQVKEQDTFTCAHCNSVHHVKPFQRDFTRCGMCDALICEQCVGQKCVPFEKRLAEMEARYNARRSYGL
jgi:hypothetical protein